MKKNNEFPEFVGKTVKRIMAYNDEDWHSITIDFTDSTSLSFGMTPHMTMKAERYRVKNGDVVVRSIRKYPPVTEDTK